MPKRKKNKYTCDSGHETITVDRDEGVTPFIIGCKHGNCGLPATSSFYMIPQASRATHEWYIPTSEECRTLNIEILEHVKQGGLLLRRIA